MPEEPTPARPAALAHTESPEERQQRLEAEYRRMEENYAPVIHRDLCLNAADTQFALAKTDAMLSVINAGAIGAVVMGGGGAALLLPAAVAAIAFGSALHHVNKGIAFSKEASTCVHDPVLEGRLAEERVLSRV